MQVRQSTMISGLLSEHIAKGTATCASDLHCEDDDRDTGYNGEPIDGLPGGSYNDNEDT